MSTCEVQDCTKRSRYNIKGNPARFCILHKTSTMANVTSKLCEFESCTIISHFNIKGEKKDDFVINTKQMI